MLFVNSAILINNTFFFFKISTHWLKLKLLFQITLKTHKNKCSLTDPYLGASFPPNMENIIEIFTLTRK